MNNINNLLKTSGWKEVEDHEWRAPSGRRYWLAAEGATSGWSRAESALLARAILQARANAEAGVLPLAVVEVKKATATIHERLERFVREVAKDQAWILLDREGRAFPHVPGEPELVENAAARPVSAPSRSPNRRQPSLFTDLNQWLLKVLLAPFLEEKLLRAPRDRPIRNVAALADLAKVSLPLATKLIRALDDQGHLDTRYGDLRLARPLDLLKQWRDRLGDSARESMPVVVVEGGVERFDRIGQLGQAFGDPAPIWGSHRACDALGFGHASGVLPMAWVPSLEKSQLSRWGVVAAQPGEKADLLLQVPRFPQTIERAAVPGSGTVLRVTDVVQSWLDVSFARVRGEEQADILWRTVFRERLK